LIEKKKALIEKLNEKRIALITQAVTKGLNPDVPMKSSGIDWLGDVPTHWDVLKLKHITRRIIDGAHFTPTYVTEGMPFLRVTDIVKSDGKLIDLNNIKFIPLEEHEELIKRCMPEKGDLLYSKNGTIGISRVIDWNWEFSIFVSLCLIKLEQEKMLPNFLSAYLESKVTQNQIAIGAKSNTVTNLHLDKIKEFIICLPPLDEQIDILESIEDELKKVDDMRHINNQTIERLTEYRTALITAAVTGKIDVRGIDIPSQEAA
ncbi:MAG: restriction endonuclease subunit S, partial [Methylobacter sp.]